MPDGRPEDLFDVFEPWTEPGGGSDEPPRRSAGARSDAAEDSGRPPWEPPPAAPPKAPVPPPERRVRSTSEANLTAAGAVEPGVVVTEVAAPHRRRRRIGPRIEAPRPTPTPPDPQDDPGPFLRAIVVPAIQDMARRLEASQHYTAVQDLLDLPTPALRVLIWPKPGLLDRGSARVLATLELMVDDEEQRAVRSRLWFGSKGEGEGIPLDTVPTSELSLDWVRKQILDFVERVLERV